MYRNVLPLLAGLALTAVLPAQARPFPFTLEGGTLDSGYRDNSAATERVVFRGEVRSDRAIWLRLRFGTTHLPASSRLRLRAVADGAAQRLDALSLRDYGHASAYFNGGRVTVELIAGPGTRANRVAVAAVEVGEMPGRIETLCGPNDQRVLSSDTRQGRTSGGCTAFLIGQFGALSAGHCMSPHTQEILEVNVPPFPGRSHPDDQYPIKLLLDLHLNSGIGADWAVAETDKNSNTGLYAGDAYGGNNWYRLGTVPGTASGQGIRITGYGTTTPPVPHSWNTVQKTHVGPLVQVGSIELGYRADSTPGNSGSPVVEESTGDVVGIHTHSGCDPANPNSNNWGTRIDRPDLQSAILEIGKGRILGKTTPFGQGCAGTGGVALLNFSGFPMVGQQFSALASNLPYFQPAALFLGVSNSQWQGITLPWDLTPHGFTGCRLYVSPDTNLGSGTGFGGATVRIDVPGVPALIGTLAYAQFAFGDPGANPAGFVVTRAAEILIGG